MLPPPSLFTTARRSSERELFLARLGILVVIAAWGLIAWRRSARIVIDYGRELFCAWRLSEGDLLYKDVWYYYGPLGATLNSLLFSIFGPGYDSLLIFNLLLIAICAFALFEMMRKASGFAQGAVAAAVFINLFAFGYGYMAQNNNFLTPYSHEATYGTYLTIGLIVALWRMHSCKKLSWLVLAGMLAAANLFTKPENLFASAVVSFFGLGFIILKNRGIKNFHFKSLAAFILPALAIGIIPTIWSFILHGGIEGVYAAHSAWMAVFSHPAITGSRSNLSFIGLAAPGEGLDRVISSVSVFATTSFSVALFCWAERIKKTTLRVSVVGIGGLLLACLIVWRLPEHLGGFLPITSAVILLFRTRAYLSAEQQGDASSDKFVLMLWSVFGMVMLLKMALFPRITHYGFFLGMPAMVDLALCLTKEVPTLISRLGGNLRYAQVAFAGLCSLIIVRTMFITVMYYGIINTAVGKGRDVMLAHDPNWHPLGIVLENVRRYLEEQKVNSLIVLPEGPALNYLLRVGTGFKGFVFNPGEIAAYGMERLLRELQEKPPERVVILSRGLSEFGYTVFGSEDGSGKKILDWVVANYEVERKFGGDPLDPDQFGATVSKYVGPKSDRKPES